MHKQSKFLVGFAAFFILLSLGGCGFTASGLGHKPGFARMRYPLFSKVNREDSVSIGPWRMGLIKKFWDLEPTEDHHSLFDYIDGIRNKSFVVEGDQDEFVVKIDLIKNDLRSQGWQEIVSFNEYNQRTEVLVKQQRSVIEGFVVLYVDDDEAQFTNIICEIDVDQLADEPIDGGWIVDLILLPVMIWGDDS